MRASHSRTYRNVILGAIDCRADLVVLRGATQCYDAGMTDHGSIPIRVLRNDVSKVIKRVEAGESFLVTRHGATVARLQPNTHKPPGNLEEIYGLRDRYGVDHELLDLVRGLRSDMRDPFERTEAHHRP